MRRASRWRSLVQLNIANLAGVPSIVYGILGLGLFVRALALQRSILAGALTLTLVVLPIVILAAQEALRAVPNSIRQASYALGSDALANGLAPSAAGGAAGHHDRRDSGDFAVRWARRRRWWRSGRPRSSRLCRLSPTDEFSALPVQISDWAGHASRPSSTTWPRPRSSCC